MLTSLIRRCCVSGIVTFCVCFMSTGLQAATKQRLAVPSTTTTVQVITLPDAILLALRNNLDIKSAQLQRVVDRYALFVAHNEFKPQYQLGGSANYARDASPSYAVGPRVSLKTPLGTQMNLSYGNAFAGGVGDVIFTITQPLLRGFGLDYNLTTLHDAMDDAVIARWIYRESIAQIIMAVIQSYRAVVQDDNDVMLQAKQVKEAQTILSHYRIEVRTGRRAANDVIQQQVNVAHASQALLEKKNRRDRDTQSLLQVLGLLPTMKLQVVSTIDTTSQHWPSLKRCIAEALKHNPTYQAALIQMRVYQRAVESAREEQKWQLDMTASSAVGSDTGSAVVPASTEGAYAIAGYGPSVGLSLSVPINDVTAKQATVDARVQLKKAQWALRKQRDQLEGDVRNRYRDIDNLRQQIAISKTGIQFSDKTIRAAMMEQQYGRLSVFEVTQMRDRLLSDRLSLVAMQLSYLNEVTALYGVMGGLLEKWHVALRD